ncbi:piggyBac transposable element-derived protein 4-like [Neoarius graeffei]|uniref:piggyBac transposable element-derived protein 4-like n=1 Tax=Neoarius graeffei TaxID=443677 RepID=UPI00298D13C8|nr:piggyBac transposable element-derived protein 4-like [Neoarius graeffei]
MPNKPAKYGIKIFWMCDARVPYAINGTVYTGKQPGEKTQKNLGEKVVQQLCSVIRQTGRNITMDNFFTSVPLAQSLLEKNLTLVGTLRQNKADIPPIMKPSDSRERYSSTFGFCGDMTMVSYVPKKKKAVVLLSTMHDDTAVDERMKKKPEVIQYYNKTKGGVDLMDQMVQTYTSKRRTRRWPMVLWQNVVDVAALNAFTVFTAHHPDYMGGVPNARRLFIKELAQELIMPHMRRRLETSLHLQKHVIQAMEMCGLQRQFIQPQEPNRVLQSKRKRCSLCPSARDKKVSHSCSRCARPVCKEHKFTQVICEMCKN